MLYGSTLRIFKIRFCCHVQWTHQLTDLFIGHPGVAMADWPRSHHGIWQKPTPWPCLRETMDLCRNVILKHNGRKLGVEHLISIENKTSWTVPKQRLNHIICRFGGLKMLKQFQGGALVKCFVAYNPYWLVRYIHYKPSTYWSSVYQLSEFCDGVPPISTWNYIPI